MQTCAVFIWFSWSALCTLTTTISFHYSGFASTAWHHIHLVGSHEKMLIKPSLLVHLLCTANLTAKQWKYTRRLFDYWAPAWQLGATTSRPYYVLLYKMGVLRIFPSNVTCYVSPSGCVLAACLTLKLKPSDSCAKIRRIQRLFRT